MADIDYDVEEQETEETEQHDETPQGLRRAANKTRKVDAINAELQRENAFLKAGINTDDPRLRYFYKGYDGELKAEAIRQAALDAGFLEAANDQQRQEEQQYTLGAQQRVMAASSGAVVEGQTEQAILMQLEQAMNEGGLEAMLEVARQYGVPTSYEGY